MHESLPGTSATHPKLVDPWQLIADIGGSNARLAAVTAGEIVDVEIYPTKAAQNIPLLMQAYVTRAATLPQNAAIAVAGPVSNGVVHLTNGQQSFAISELSKLTSVGEVRCLNDFEAAAWALQTVNARDVTRLQGAIDLPTGTRLVIGPGTGLGTGVLACDGATSIAVAGEGGHVGLSPQTKFEVAVFEALRGVWPEVFFGERHCVEAEAILSGSGLPKLYQAVCAVLDQTPVAKTAAEVLQNPAPTCRATACVIDLFKTHLGQVTGDMALTCMAYGGVFIAGGVATKNPWLFDQKFLDAFNAGGRFSKVRTELSVYLLLDSDFGLIGARNAALATQNSRR